MKGFIYIIRTHQSDDVYYGCTMELLCRRMAKHRYAYKSWLNGKYNYVTSFELIKYDDAYIELVEEVEFMNKATLYTREGHYIRENKCVNKQIAGRTRQQCTQDYYKANKDIINEQNKHYYETNKAKILEQQKQYREERRAESK